METSECQGCGNKINIQNLINLKQKKVIQVSQVIVHRQTCSKGRGWNVLDLSLNKIDWFDYGILTNCYFYVSQTGRNYMNNVKERYLHAWIVCEYQKSEQFSSKNMRKITYNPYENTTFIYQDSNIPVFTLDKVFLTPEGVFDPN